MELDTDAARLKKAKAQLGKIKSFYAHALVYAVVSLTITISAITTKMQQGNTFMEALDWGSFMVWFLWGTGLFFHGLNAHGKRLFFSAKWEERQIRKYMEQEEREAQKYK
ncbi:2TM domain-containing protein [Maribacter sp. 2307ULW6-5]|uniref:2TM domain-containing protein n=1 Tax=Maribacter sp. 2307ULW6-5 TaxID=3386275 RepID=UPI0039BD4EC4